MLFYQAVPENLLKILNHLMRENALSAFTLVGGTALALQMGHRISVDIDLFTDHSFEPKEILGTLRKSLKVELIMNRPNGMQLIIENCKVDLYNWAVPFIEKPYLIDGYD